MLVDNRQAERLDEMFEVKVDTEVTLRQACPTCGVDDLMSFLQKVLAGLGSTRPSSEADHLIEAYLKELPLPAPNVWHDAHGPDKCPAGV